MKRDMTTGSPGKTLLLFAIPMVLGNLFQQLYNIIDSIIVGNYVGADALAAVGASTTLVMLFVAIVTGLSIGGSVVIGQYYGAGSFEKVKSSVTTMLITAVGISLVLTAVGLMISGPVLKLMKTPDYLMEDAETYLDIYFMGFFFLFLYNALNAVYNALGDSKTPLVFLFFSSVLNVFLDVQFVTQFDMGVAGVAWATLIAQGVSAVLSLIWLTIRMKDILRIPGVKLFDTGILKTICKMAIPSCLQQSIVSLGFVSVQALVNRYGGDFMAGYTAAIKIDSMAILPMVNVGNAVSNFTAQNIGAGKYERVGNGLKAGLLLSSAIAIAVSALLLVCGDVLVGLFVDSELNPEVIATGTQYLHVVGVCYVIMGAMNNVNGALRGAGDAKRTFINTLCNFGTRVVLAYGLAGAIGPSVIWYSIPAGWLVALTMGIIRYRGGKWKQMKVVK